MSVVRINLEKCVGCRACVNVCPMDVFYFDEAARKSVIAYPENCQSCGQCYLYCPVRSIGISTETYSYPITAWRAVSTGQLNSAVITDAGVLSALTEGNITSRAKK